MLPSSHPPRDHFFIFGFLIQKKREGWMGYVAEPASVVIQTSGKENIRSNDQDGGVYNIFMIQFFILYNEYRSFYRIYNLQNLQKLQNLQNRQILQNLQNLQNLYPTIHQLLLLDQVSTYQLSRGLPPMHYHFILYKIVMNLGNNSTFWIFTFNNKYNNNDNYKKKKFQLLLLVEGIVVFNLH